MKALLQGLPERREGFAAWVTRGMLRFCYKCCKREVKALLQGLPEGGEGFATGVARRG